MRVHHFFNPSMNPDRLSTLLVMLLSVVLPLVSWSFKKNSFNKDNFIVFLIITASLLWSTQIRSSLLSLAVVSFFVFYKMNGYEFKEYLKSKAISIKVALLSSSVAFIPICAFLFYLKPNSALGRLLIWKVSFLELLLPNWFFCIGFGNYSWAYNRTQSAIFSRGVGRILRACWLVMWSLRIFPIIFIQARE